MSSLTAKGKQNIFNSFVKKFTTVGAKLSKKDHTRFFNNLPPGWRKVLRKNSIPPTRYIARLMLLVLSNGLDPNLARMLYLLVGPVPTKSIEAWRKWERFRYDWLFTQLGVELYDLRKRQHDYSSIPSLRRSLYDLYNRPFNHHIPNWKLHKQPNTAYVPQPQPTAYVPPPGAPPTAVSPYWHYANLALNPATPTDPFAGISDFDILKAMPTTNKNPYSKYNKRVRTKDTFDYLSENKTKKRRKN